MARWSYHGWTAGNATSSASGQSIDGGSSALSFGGGSRSSFQSNITLNTYSLAMHHAASTASSSTDICSSPHLWPIYPTNTLDTGCVIDGTYQAMSRTTTVSSPHAARGIGLKFVHDFAVSIAPVAIWGGTAPGIVNAPQSALIAVCDLSTGSVGTPTWSTVSPSSTLSLKVHSSASYEDAEHWWSVGIAVQPTAVGHNGENVVRTECTYY